MAGGNKITRLQVVHMTKRERAAIKARAQAHVIRAKVRGRFLRVRFGIAFYISAFKRLLRRMWRALTARKD